MNKKAALAGALVAIFFLASMLFISPDVTADGLRTIDPIGPKDGWSQVCCGSMCDMDRCLGLGDYDCCR